MSGKYELLLQTLAQNTDTVVFISTKYKAESVLSDYQRITKQAPTDRIGIIDCVTPPEAQQEQSGSAIVQYVNSPSNLTDIGIAFTNLFDTFYSPEQENVIGIGVHSITNFIMHVDIRTIYQFLQVLTGQIRVANGFAVATMDTTSESNDHAQLLHHHFDGEIQTRINPHGDREYRIRGLAPTTSEWIGF